MRNIDLSQQVKELYEYVESSWESNQVPSIIQAKYELGYDTSFEIDLKKTIDFQDPFEEVLHALVELNKVVIDVDERGIGRMYPPEEIIIRKIAEKLYLFLEPIWEKTFIPRKMFIYEEFAYENMISRNQFEKAIIVLETFKIIETLQDSSCGIRIIKSQHSKSKIL